MGKSLLDVVEFVGDRRTVLKQDIEKEFGERMYRNVYKNSDDKYLFPKCESPIFHLRYVLQERSIEDLKYNEDIDEKIAYSYEMYKEGGRKYREKLSKTKKSLYYDKYVELHNNYIRKMRAICNHYIKNNEGGYSFEFSTNANVDIKIGTTLYNYCPEFGFTANNEQIYWGERLKQYVNYKVKERSDMIKSICLEQQMDKGQEYVNVKFHREDVPISVLDDIVALGDKAVSVKFIKK